MAGRGGIKIGIMRWVGHIESIAVDPSWHILLDTPRREADVEKGVMGKGNR